MMKRNADLVNNSGDPSGAYEGCHRIHEGTEYYRPMVHFIRQEAKREGKHAAVF